MDVPRKGGIDQPSPREDMDTIMTNITMLMSAEKIYRD